MTDIAKLGVEIDTTPIVAATQALDTFDDSGKKVGITADKMTEANRRLAESYAKLTDEQKKMFASAGSQPPLVPPPPGPKNPWKSIEEEMRLVNAQNIAMSETNKILAGSTTVVASGTKVATSALTELSLSSAMAQRELVILGREIVTGNFSRIPGSFSVLARSTGVLPLLMSTAGAAIGAVVATVAGLGFAAIKGAEEQKALQNAIALTGNFAGVTEGQLAKLAETTSNASRLTVGASKDIIKQLVGSGVFGAASTQALAGIAGPYAQATGVDSSKVAGELIKMFEDPAKGAEKLNSQMHFLTNTQTEYINTLVRIGEKEQARIYLIEQTNTHLSKQNTELGTIEGVLNSAAKAWSDFWNAALNIGKQSAVEQKLKEAEEDVVNLGRVTSRKTAPEMFAAADLLVSQLKQQLQLGRENAAAQGQVSQEMQRQAEFGKELQATDSYRLRSLQDQLGKFTDNPGNRAGLNEVDYNRKVFELRKSIFDLQRAMGAEVRTYLQSEFDQVGKLNSLSIKGNQDLNASRLAGGEILKFQFEENKKNFDLEQNQTEQIAVKGKLSLGGLSVLEKQNLVYELERLVVSRQLIEANYIQNTQAEVRKNQLASYLKMYEEQRTVQQELADSQAKQQVARDKVVQDASANLQLAKDEQEVAQFELTLMGLSEAARSRAVAILKAELEVRRSLNALQAEGNPLSPTAANNVLTDAREAASIKAEIASNKKAADEVSQYWKNAAKHMQSAMSDFFFDVMQGKLTNLGSQFKKAIDRMVADALAAKASSALFGENFAKGGDLGGLVGQGLKFFGIGTGSSGGLGYGSASGGLVESIAAGQVMGPYASGTNYVPKTGFAYVHEGEKITPAGKSGAPMQVTNVFHIHGQMDRRSQAQVAVLAGQGVSRALSRDG